jgi:hypothetical protein
MTNMISISILFVMFLMTAAYKHSRTRLLNQIRSQPRERRESFLHKICKDYGVNPNIDPRDIASFWGGRG